MSAPLDSRQLKAFVSLARTGSFTATAKELFLTHSAISHSMKALENDAGCRLLIKMGKKVTLSEAGEALLSHAERILREMTQARGALQHLNRWGVQRLRLATGSSLCQEFLPRALATLKKELPRLLIKIHIPGSLEMLDLLERNQVDVLLGEAPATGSGRVEFTPLFEDRFYIVVNSAHPWAASGHAPRDQVTKEPCILPAATHPSRQLVDDHFAEEDLALNTVLEVNSVAAIRAFVAQGLGMTVLPRWTVQRDLAAGYLVALPIGRRHLSQQWGLVHWGGRPLDHVQSVLVKSCRASVAAFLANHTDEQSPRPGSTDAVTGAALSLSGASLPRTEG